MAQNLDFTPKTQAIDPTALATALQNKARIEQQQSQYEQDRKDNTFKRITDAVIAGQNIANNMLTMADKRTEVKKKQTEAEGQKELIGLFGEPTTLPDGDPLKEKLEPAFQADRNKRFLQAVTKADLDGTTAALLKEKFAGNESRAGDTETSLLLFKGDKNPRRVIIDKNKRKVYSLDGSEIDPSRLVDAEAGFAPKLAKDQFGNPILSAASVGSEAEPVGAQIASEAEKEGGIVALQSNAPVLAERFSSARDKAYPAYNETIKQAGTGAAAASQALKILKQKEINEVALKSLGFNFAIMSGSNSQLSDAERENFEAPLQFLEKLKNKGYKLVAGELSPKMKSDLVNLGETLYKKNKIRVRKEILSAKQNAKGHVGKTRWEKYQLDKEFPTEEELITSTEEMSSTDQEADSLANILGLKKKGQ